MKKALRRPTAGKPSVSRLPKHICCRTLRVMLQVPIALTRGRRHALERLARATV